jgi:hypothetical protein
VDEDPRQHHPGPLDIGRAADCLAVTLSVVEAMPGSPAKQMAKALRRYLKWLSARRREAEKAQQSKPAAAYSEPHSEELDGRR